VSATIAKAVQSRQLMEAVDVVIIDEAGMVDLPSAWCAAGMAGGEVDQVVFLALAAQAQSWSA